jgi:glutamine cyclotransferase
MGNASGIGAKDTTSCLCPAARGNGPKGPVYGSNPNGLSWPFMSRRVRLLALFLFAAAVFTLAKLPASHRADGYQVLNTYPHDSHAFTQGLVCVDGHLYESTGIKGESSVRMVDLSTAKVLQKYDLPAEYFGEGLTDWGSTLVQLTWKEHTGFVYDRFSFSVLRTFHYTGEGWGLTHDETQLIMSDGTSYLRFLDPKSFKETRRIRVSDETGRPVEKLNELEYLHGEIYANIWETDEIVRISPQTGKVLGWIDLKGIIDKRSLGNPDAVLNGIAHDSAGDRLFVTGKLWPKLFEIKIVPAGGR